MQCAMHATSEMRVRRTLSDPVYLSIAEVREGEAWSQWTVACAVGGCGGSHLAPGRVCTMPGPCSPSALRDTSVE